jgi:uncharacterized membrane protein
VFRSKEEEQSQKTDQATTIGSQPVLLLTGIIFCVALLACVAYYLFYISYDEKLSVRITADVIVIHDFFSSVYLL